MQEKKSYTFSSFNAMEHLSMFRSAPDLETLKKMFHDYNDYIEFRYNLGDITEREYRLFQYWGLIVLDDCQAEFEFNSLFPDNG